VRTPVRPRPAALPAGDLPGSGASRAGPPGGTGLIHPTMVGLDSPVTGPATPATGESTSGAPGDPG
jgi:hypothetical protein